MRLHRRRPRYLGLVAALIGLAVVAAFTLPITLTHTMHTRLTTALSQRFDGDVAIWIEAALASCGTWIPPHHIQRGNVESLLDTELLVRPKHSTHLPAPSRALLGDVVRLCPRVSVAKTTAPVDCQSTFSGKHGLVRNAPHPACSALARAGRSAPYERLLAKTNAGVSPKA